MSSFNPRCAITNRMTAAITRIERAWRIYFINANLRPFGLSTLTSESNHPETLDCVQVVKAIGRTLRK